MFWFRLNILCRVSGYRGHVVRRDLSCEIFRLGKRISERCAVPIGVLIIPADGTRGQGLGFNLGSRDGRHQGLYLQGGEVGSGSRFLGRGIGSGVRAQGCRDARFCVSVRSRPRAGASRLCLSASLPVVFGLSSWRRSTVVLAAPSRRPAVRPPTVRRTHRPAGTGLNPARVRDRSGNGRYPVRGSSAEVASGAWNGRT